METENKDLFIAKIRLLNHLLYAGYLNDIRLFKAFLSLPLKKFIPKRCIKYSKIYNDAPYLFYFDKSSPENIRTISAPHMITIMIQNLMLKEDDNLLILGAKSGYIAALAHQLAPKGKIKILEANSRIAKITAKNLSKMNLQEDIEVIVKNPLEGLPELKPWSKILVTGSIKTPRIYPLLKQLNSEYGVLFAPIGEETIQTYTQILRDSDQYFAEEQLQVKFTPLITQLEIDEFQLITDSEVLEQEDDEVIKFEETKISLKYKKNIFDEATKRPEYPGKVSEIKLKNIYIAFLEYIIQSINNLKEDKGLKNWLNSIENFNLILLLIKDSKGKRKIEVKEMEKSLILLTTLNMNWLELEKNNNHEESFEAKKIEILHEHLLEMNNFQKAVQKILKNLS
ncbi:MAG: hypothetical protein ACTSV5_02825 [Promethearchaeota archaeon]